MSWFNEAANECAWPRLWKMAVIASVIILILLIAYAA